MSFFKFFLLASFLLVTPDLVFAEKVFFFEGEVDFQKNEFNIVVDLGEESDAT